MKKIITTSFTFFLFLIIAWGLSSWYFGVQAEKEFRQILEVQTNKLGEKPFRLELLDYDKDFLGSTAAVRVSSDIPLLNDWLGDFELKLKSLNGPLFITKKGVDFGVSRWFIRIDPESFSAESKENLFRIFPEELPKGVLIIGFDKESSFDSSFKTDWLDSQVTAIYNLSTFSYRGAFDIKRLNYSSTGIKISADEGKISFQYPNSVETLNEIESSNLDNPATYKTVSINVPQLNIDSQIISHPIVAALKGNSQITIKNNVIDTFVKLHFNRLKQSSDQNNEVLPIDQLQITAQGSGIQQSSFLQVMENKAELDNLQMQTQWELQENGELPEGQDKIWQLQNQIHRLNQKYPVSFYNALFSSKDNVSTNPSLEIQASNDSGQSSLIGHLKPSVNSGESTRFIDLLEAEASVSLDDMLYDFISKRTAIRKKQFSLLYKQNKLLMQ
ncbi:DUF945 family protein [uncultured Cocleimonas sp.]|uniref:DUF945 family protein n=1 Tax=uncultured Cocleimonas sp. TaxID=1051587 RepID=UPI002613BD44|nr:DUF945 family protein [uncultured Cocleimonas sp.]